MDKLKVSMSNRKPIYGWGINDADYVVERIINGKRIMCPYYRTWHNMITRCYSSKYQHRQPTYVGCTVCEEWRYFMAFRSWMETQDWRGLQIDKDIIKPGNKVYSPDTCVFVTRKINQLLTDHGALRGKWPRGVSWHNTTKKYIARCHDGSGYQKHLGLFTTVDEASKVYREFKHNHILNIAEQQTNKRIADGFNVDFAQFEISG